MQTTVAGKHGKSDKHGHEICMRYGTEKRNTAVLLSPLQDVSSKGVEVRTGYPGVLAVVSTV